MTDGSHKRHRRSIRLKGYDYSQEGGYFVTICTQDRECVFGEIMDGEMRLSSIGKIAEHCWLEIPSHFTNIALDVFVIMPNHVHGIIIIQEPTVGVQHVEPLHNKYQHIIPHSIGTIVRSYKSAVTKKCHEIGLDEFKWQRNYYEHIIRNERDLTSIQKYIEENPWQWYYDKENPANIKMRYV